MPEIWTQENFKKLYDALSIEGKIVTFSAKGSVRRDLESVGFTVTRLPGPPGKKHMTMAQKLN
jgi:tRNA U34 5-methylaminomethyl-2-thiouridine-forming methyltransferase MnmC